MNSKRNGAGAIQLINVLPNVGLRSRTTPKVRRTASCYMLIRDLRVSPERSL